MNQDSAYRINDGNTNMSAAYGINGGAANASPNNYGMQSNFVWQENMMPIRIGLQQPMMAAAMPNSNGPSVQNVGLQLVHPGTVLTDGMRPATMTPQALTAAFERMQMMRLQDGTPNNEALQSMHGNVYNARPYYSGSVARDDALVQSDESLPAPSHHTQFVQQAQMGMGTPINVNSGMGMVPLQLSIPGRLDPQQVPFVYREPQQPQAQPPQQRKNGWDVSPSTLSNLSADAPEFVPSGFRSQGQGHSGAASNGMGYNPDGSSAQPFPVQNHASKLAYNSCHLEPCRDVQNGIPGQQRQTPQQPVTSGSQGSPNSSTSSDEDLALLICRFKSTLDILTSDPAKYQKLKTGLFNLIRDEQAYMDYLVAIFWKQAITCANFRYSAARFCKDFLDKSDTGNGLTASGNRFADLIVEQFRNVPRNEPTPDIPLDGVVLFLSELIFQNCKNWQEMSSLLLEFHSALLSDGSQVNLKCICQSLKLSGSQICLTDSVGRLGELVSCLEKVENPGSAVHLINQIVEMRKSVWPLSNNESSTAPVTSAPAPPVSTVQSMPSPYSSITNNNSSSTNEGHCSNDDPVFYGPDGSELTYEERQFLHEQMKLLDSDEEDDDDSLNLINDQDLEEMDRAYSKFLQNVHNRNSRNN